MSTPFETPMNGDARRRGKKEQRKATAKADREASAAFAKQEPIPLGEVPAVSPFPLEVYPSRLRRFAEVAAASLGCPVDFIAGPMLAATAAAIGGSRCIRIKVGYTEPCVLNLGMVGVAGSGKTPGQNLVMNPLWAEQRRQAEAWRQRVEQHRQEHEVYEEALKEWKKKREGPAPEKPSPPAPCVRILTTDFTKEGLAPVLENNPRGILALKDELVGWVKSMDAYKDGTGGKGDRQFWLSAWSAESQAIDRVKNLERGPIILHKPHISVCGGLVPDRLADLRGNRQGDDADGFLDRILLDHPDPLPLRGETWGELDPLTAMAWSGALERLFTLDLVQDKDGGRRAHPVPLGREARAAWERFTTGHAGELNDPNFPDHLRSPWSKLRGYCARLALILEYLAWAASTEAEEPKEISGAAMEGAAKLIDHFKAHCKKVHHCIDPDRKQRDALRVIKWLTRTYSVDFANNANASLEKRTTSVRDIHRGVMGSRRTVEQTEGVVSLLVKHGFLRLRQAESHPGPGRKPGPCYEVHPSLCFSGSGSRGSQNRRNDPEADRDDEADERAAIEAEGNNEYPECQP